MLIQYTKSPTQANVTAAKVVADLIALITQTKQTSTLSDACNKDKTFIVGRAPVKSPSIVLEDAANKISWIRVDHPLYENHFTYVGFDYSSGIDIVLKMAEKYDAETKTFSKMTPMSNAGTLKVCTTYSLIAVSRVIEILVSASGVLFVGNNESTMDASNNPAYPPYNPVGLFVLEAVSSVQGGINAASGATMFALGSISNALESTSVYSSGSGQIGGPNTLRTANLGTDFAYVGGTLNSGVAGRETPTYSHNGALETTFLEAYVFPGDMIYAKLHGIVRPQLNINHARNRTTAASVEYYGMVNWPNINVNNVAAQAANANGYQFVYAKL
ncbi:hypothetical protein [Yersinia ruckeri]|uniref:hypothetical protein n=1 Tax=Yersinia ruckeri TaxID=29486 RepID=UPI00223880C0|nr:hypothetical protein [Yersinia ruckeri]MCW6598840.1 hypothetical protein [Yersinia ruckeri]